MNALLFSGLRQNPPSSFSLLGMAHKKDQKGIKLQLTHFGWYTKQSNTASKKPTSFILWKTLCGRYSGATPRISFVSSCFHKSTAQNTITSYVPIYLIDASWTRESQFPNIWTNLQQANAIQPEHSKRQVLYDLQSSVTISKRFAFRSAGSVSFWGIAM